MQKIFSVKVYDKVRGLGCDMTKKDRIYRGLTNKPLVWEGVCASCSLETVCVTSETNYLKLEFLVYLQYIGFNTRELQFLL